MPLSAVLCSGSSPFIETIDNMHHYGYETNKCHLFWAGFVPPIKFINIFIQETKHLFCALKFYTIKEVVTKGLFLLHTATYKE